MSTYASVAVSANRIELDNIALQNGYDCLILDACLLESYNAILKGILARLHRSTKCYSKSEEMLMLSVLLLIHQFNSRKIIKQRTQI